MRKKPITAFIIFLLIVAWLLFPEEYEKNASPNQGPLKEIQFVRQANLTKDKVKRNTETIKYDKKTENIKKLFEKKHLIEIKKCLPTYSSTAPKELKEMVLPANANILFSRKNIHYKNNSGAIFQVRSEGSPNNLESFFFKVENELPIKISKNEFSNEIRDAEIIYKESIQKSKKAEIVIVNNQLIKIENNTPRDSLSCDFNEGEWECFCFKEN
tara:strand:+ start:179 stop:820 length:642 start_codon:yes stop_codon:yes gene_type:complete